MTTRLYLTCLLILVATLSAPARAGGIWPLLPDDGAAGDGFGSAVALHGSNALIGAFRHDGTGPDSGAAYLFDARSGEQTAKLLPDDGSARDFFGRAVALSGDLALVGAHGVDGAGAQSGAAYLFDASTGIQLAKLSPQDGAPGDHFGWSVALHGTVAVVGAPRHDTVGANAGAVYVFDTTTGSELFKLSASDGAAGDEFGQSVALGDSFLVVGAHESDHAGVDSGSAYVFDVETGAELATLQPEGAGSGGFGFSAAVHGSKALIGTYSPGAMPTVDGAASLFDLTTGDLLAAYAPDSVSPDGTFGYSVSLNCAHAVVGAYSPSTVVGGSSFGSVYVFDTGSGGTTARLFQPAPGPDDLFGASVAISSLGVISGSPRESTGGTSDGVTYVFPSHPHLVEIDVGAVSIGEWLSPSSGDEQQFGKAVAADGPLAVVGAPGENEAYVIDLDSGAVLRGLNQGTLASTRFGEAVAIDGERVVVGDPLAKKAYLFDALTGDLLQVLEPEGGPLSHPGTSVAIDGDRVLVGDPFVDSAFMEAGSAYLFDATTGAQLARLESAAPHDYAVFGFAVALEGGRAFVGAPSIAASFKPGAVHVFDAGVGAPLGTWQASTLAISDGFGRSLAVSGDLALVGAQDSPLAVSPLSAYVFDVASGELQETLTPFFGGGSSGFGASVAVGSSHALISAPSASQVLVYDLDGMQEVARVDQGDEGLTIKSLAISGSTGLVGLGDLLGFFGDPGAVLRVGLAVSKWTDLCDGLPGVAGVPSLQGDGPLKVGTIVTLALSEGAPFAPAFLALGAEVLGEPLRGGILVPSPELVIGGLATDALGELELLGVVPSELPPASSFYLQCWIADAAAPQAFSASNGLAGTTD
jgi:outer membrane protein assembly factor BamB